MNFFMRLPIFYKIITFAVFIISLTGLIILFTNLSTDKLREREDATLLKSRLLSIRNLEKNFLASRDITYADTLSSELGYFVSEAAAFGDTGIISSVTNGISGYRLLFNELKNAVIQRGLDENSGSEGELRNSVHKIEDIVLKAGRDDILIDMLYARRSEKDFIMRGSPKYVEKVNNAVDDIVKHTTASPLATGTKNQIINLAEDYRTKFGAMAKSLNKIKNIEEQLDVKTAALIPQLDLLVQYKLGESQTYAMYKNIFIVFTILFALVTAYLIGTIITRPVKKLQTLATEISAGNYDAKVDVAAQDEIGQLAVMLNGMAEKIKSSRHELLTEKAGVEKKVEDAVQESENQKKYLSESIDLILIEMKRFENGDLTANLAVRSDDEIGRLFTGFNRAVANIREMLLRVDQAVSLTTETSYEILNKSAEMSDGSNRQSNEVSKITASIERMTLKITETSGNAASAAESAGKSVNVATDGGRDVENTLSGIKSLAQVVADSTEKVTLLGKNSSEIGSIVKVIDDIADQTNLLALNAAIEAARAGEQGRGFAVVADEVRKLAEKTTRATKEIESMIKQIQSETESVVKVMNEGKKRVDNDVTNAVKAGNSLSEIINSSKELVDKINLVAKANDEQTVEAEQISHRIDSINQVAYQVVAGNEDITRKSEELKQMMENLRDLVNGFTVEQSSRKIYKPLMRING